MSKTTTLESPLPPRRVQISTSMTDEGEIIEISLPFKKAPAKLHRELLDNGFRPLNAPGPLSYFAQVTSEAWAYAFSVKQKVEAGLGPLIDPKLIETFPRAEDTERPARRGEVDLEKSGVERETIFHFRDPANVDLLREQSSRIFRELGILDLYLVTTAESGFFEEVNSVFMRHAPLKPDGQGGFSGTGAASPLDEEDLDRLLDHYIPGESATPFLAKVMGSIMGQGPVSPNDLGYSKKQRLGIIDRALQRFEGSDPQVIDHLLELRSELSPPKAKPETTNKELALQIRLLTDTARKIAGWQGTKVPLKQVSGMLDRIEQLVGEIGAENIPPVLKQSLAYLEGRLIEVYNRTIHRSANFKVSIQFDQRKLKALRGFRSGELGEPAYLVEPPKVAGEHFAVSYGQGESPEFSGEFFQLEKPWKDLLGMPPVGFSALLSGPPKQGKSTLALGLASYLARRGYGPVLFASFEEAHNPSLTEKRQRLGITADQIEFKNYLPADLSPWPVVMVDSITKAHIGMQTIEELLTRYPRTTFVFISQVTKAGKARGSNEIPHEVDVLIEVKDGLATALGRFGSGEMPVAFSSSDNTQTT